MEDLIQLCVAQIQTDSYHVLVDFRTIPVDVSPNVTLFRSFGNPTWNQLQGKTDGVCKK